MLTTWSNAEILQLINIIATIIVAIISLMAVKIGRESHILMNSRLSELLSARAGEARAEGVAQERSDTEARKNKGH